MGIPLFKTPDEPEPCFTASMEKFLSNSRSSIRRNRFRAIPRLDAHRHTNPGDQRPLGSDTSLDGDYEAGGMTANPAYHAPSSEFSSRRWYSQYLRALDHERERTGLRDCLNLENQHTSNPVNRTLSTEARDQQREDDSSSLPSRIRPTRISRRGFAIRQQRLRSIRTNETLPRLVSSVSDVEPSLTDMYVRDQSNASTELSVPESFTSGNNGISFSRRYPLLHFAFHRTRALNQLSSRIEGHPLNISQSNSNQNREILSLNSESDDFWDNNVTNSNLSDIQQNRESSIETVITAPRSFSSSSSELANTDKNDGSTMPSDNGTNLRTETRNEDLDEYEDGDRDRDRESQSLFRSNNDQMRPYTSVVAEHYNIVDYGATSRFGTLRDWSNTSTAIEPDDILEDWWASVG